ncbi:Hypothetical protein, putative, partial [Bodo saltans]
MLLIVQGFTSNTLHMDIHLGTSAHEPVVLTTKKPILVPSNPRLESVEADAQRQPSPEDDCTLDRRELILGLGQDTLPAVGSAEFPSADHTKQHLDAL